MQYYKDAWPSATCAGHPAFTHSHPMPYNLVSSIAQNLIHITCSKHFWPSPKVILSSSLIQIDFAVGHGSLLCVAT
eukprot:579612-Pelagomonas_calceolata.AAC.2